MENEEILSEMFSAGADELSEADYQSQLMERLDTIIENQAYTSIQLQSVLEAQASAVNALYAVLGLALLITAFKILWTVVSKWLFGGV